MSLYALDGVAPELPADGDFWVAPGARLSGRIVLAKGASVWFNAVLRGDNEPIVVGEGSNVQDNCVCHTDHGYPLTIGPDCTIGHMAILHGCIVGEGSLVGMGATLLNGAVIGKGVLVGAGALVTEGKEIPDGVLVVGRPGKVVRNLTPAEIAGLRKSAAGYRANMARFRAGLRPAAGLRATLDLGRALAEARLDPVARGHERLAQQRELHRVGRELRDGPRPRSHAPRARAAAAVRRPSTASVMRAVRRGPPAPRPPMGRLFSRQRMARIGEPHQRPRRGRGGRPPRPR